MRLHICDTNDAVGFARFRELLDDKMGATCLSKSWGIGVDHWQLRIGDETLDVFSDAYTVDIDGSAKLVAQIAEILQL